MNGISGLDIGESGNDAMTLKISFTCLACIVDGLDSILYNISIVIFENIHIIAFVGTWWHHVMTFRNDVPFLTRRHDVANLLHPPSLIAAMLERWLLLFAVSRLISIANFEEMSLVFSWWNEDNVKCINEGKTKTVESILHYFTLHYRHFKRHLHLKWPVAHQQLHAIRNTAHRPSTQASYTASRVRPKRKISCAAAQIAATLTISFPRWRHMSLTS